MPAIATSACCPSCGSKNLRRRKRRFYDVPFTWLLASVSGGLTYGDCDAGWYLGYVLPTGVLPQPAKVDTPRLFSRCLDCDERWTDFKEQGRDIEAGSDDVALTNLDNPIRPQQFSS